MYLSLTEKERLDFYEIMLRVIDYERDQNGHIKSDLDRNSEFWIDGDFYTADGFCSMIAELIKNYKPLPFVVKETHIGNISWNHIHMNDFPELLNRCPLKPYRKDQLWFDGTFGWIQRFNLLKEAIQELKLKIK